MGFAANIGAVTSTEVAVVPDDLVRYGMIPEFVGRFCTCVCLQDLTKTELIHILTGVRSNLVAQYQWLFEEDGINLEFDAESLELIAQRTLETRTGARGLHNELERVLLPHMFDLPRYNKHDIVKVTINKTQVNTPMTLLKQNQ
jgi:ATP-dependent Clp protease ATP-binding subunit ClpX